MPSAGERGRTAALRVVLVGTGTGIGKTHVACALLASWRGTRTVAGLKPIETGVSLPTSASVTTRSSAGQDRGGGLDSGRRVARLGSADRQGGRPTRRRSGAEPSDQERLADAAELFHVKRARRGSAAGPHPVRSLYAFAEPVSPHLAARLAGTRIDLGLVERWVTHHAAAATIIETAGGLFSPLGNGTTNFDLMQALRPDAVILVASDRLGVLHELTTTLALCAARGGPALGVVLSAPGKKDASTGRNARELIVLGIATPLVTFPRAEPTAALSAEAAGRVIAWLETPPADRAASVPAAGPSGRRAARGPDATGRH